MNLLRWPAIFLSACAALSEPSPAQLDKSKQLAFARGKGNCLGCQAIADGESPGNIGPPLAHLSARFNHKEALRRQIWHAGRFNPATSMPPFGKNAILNADEIDAIADYLWCLP